MSQILQLLNEQLLVDVRGLLNWSRRTNNNTLTYTSPKGTSIFIQQLDIHILISVSHMGGTCPPVLAEHGTHDLNDPNSIDNITKAIQFMKNTLDWSS